MATQQDVARLAGTSAAVVSYVLNNGPRPVSEKTRARVLAAMAELDFRPNNAARSLRSGRSQVLGLIIPDSSHPFFADVARRVEQRAYERGYVIMTGNSLNDPVREAEYFALFREHGADGVILTVDPTADVSPLLGAGIPAVLMDMPSAGIAMPSVSVDYRAAAADATRHLLRAGHTRVGFVGGPAGIPSADARFDGWQDVMQEAELPTDLVARVPFTRKAGYEAAQKMLAGTAPTAIFNSSDQQAIGVLRGVGEKGLRTPDDIWLMAFDDSDDCLYTNPQLSTVRQPVPAMVDRCLDLLLTPGAPMTHEVFPHELVLRASTGGSISEEPARRLHEGERAPSR